MPLDFIKQNMTVKYNGGKLVEGVDYKIEAEGDTDEKFVLTFLKAIPGVTQTNPVTIEYLAQDVVSEAGEGMAENPGGGKTGNQKELYNYAQLKNGALTTDKKTKVDMGGLMPKTGDAGHAMIWILLLMMSGCGLISFYAAAKRRKG